MLRREEGQHLFGLDPAGYESGRPDYPERVYEILRVRCGLRPGSHVLEVGPGTGLVTRHLLQAEARVTVLEPDPRLAEYMITTYPEVEVLATSLEDAVIAKGEHNLVAAATSFHWVDQRIGLTKVGESLKQGGWAAIWWTLFRDPGRPDEFATAVERILGPDTRGAFDEAGRPPFQLDAEHRRRDLSEWGGLVDVESELFHWPCVLDPARARALYASMATVLRRPHDEQERLLDAIEQVVSDRFGGAVERRFVTAIYTGRRL
ncbi:MAG: class I SAM-dependent methyltransferase [Acidimicrobiales bacterium]